MNIRLSPEGVRVRASLEEARQLLSTGKLAESVPISGGAVSMTLELAPGGPNLLRLFWEGRVIRVLVQQEALSALLEEKPTRDSTISQASEGFTPLSFEIDLFSLKGGKKPQ